MNVQETSRLSPPRRSARSTRRSSALGPRYQRQGIAEVLLQDHLVLLQLAQQEHEHFPRCFVQVHRFNIALLIAKKGSQAGDHIRGSIAIANRAAHGFTRTLKVRRIAIEHPKACACISDDAGQRLIDFVRDRCRQSAERCHSRNMGELGTRLVESFFGGPALGDIFGKRHQKSRRALCARNHGDAVARPNHAVIFSKISLLDLKLLPLSL